MTPAQIAKIMALVDAYVVRLWEFPKSAESERAAVEAALSQAEPTRSEKLRGAGYTRRPTWKSLPRDDDDEQDTSAPTAVEPVREKLMWCKSCGEGATTFCRSPMTAIQNGCPLFSPARASKGTK